MHISSLFQKFFSSHTLNNFINKSIKKDENSMLFKKDISISNMDRITLSDATKKVFSGKNIYVENSKSIKNLSPKIIEIFEAIPNVRAEKVKLFKKKIEDPNYMKTINYEKLFYKIMDTSYNFLLNLDKKV